MKLQVSDVPELNKNFTFKNFYQSLKALGFIQYFLYALPLLFIYIAITNFTAARNIESIHKSAVQTSATIQAKYGAGGTGTSIGPFCFDCHPAYSFTYTFTATDGKMYSASRSSVKNAGDLSYYQEFQAGDRVPVIYDRDHPKDSYLQSNIPDSQKSYTICIICLVGAILIGYASHRYYLNPSNGKSGRLWKRS